MDIEGHGDIEGRGDMGTRDRRGHGRMWEGQRDLEDLGTQRDTGDTWAWQDVGVSPRVPGEGGSVTPAQPVPAVSLGVPRVSPGVAPVPGGGSLGLPVGPWGDPREVSPCPQGVPGGVPRGVPVTWGCPHDPGEAWPRGGCPRGCPQDLGCPSGGPMSLGVRRGVPMSLRVYPCPWGCPHDQECTWGVPGSVLMSPGCPQECPHVPEGSPCHWGVPRGVPMTQGVPGVSSGVSP